MAFPQQQYPQVVHLFVNEFNTLLSSGTPAITDFYTGCTKHCINFLSLYGIQSVLPGSATALSNFINLGKTSYGIIDFAGSIDLYNPASNGLSRFNLIDTYNTNNPSNKINWITLENEFWNLSSQPNITYNSSCQVSNSTVVTLINGLTTAASYFVVGNPITIDGYNRQIVSINSATQITLDRPINAAIVSGNITIYDVANTTYMLNFDTFLERLKTLRGLTQSKGMKIEAYLARKIPAVQWRQLVPYIDRVLIENDYDKYNYCLYNDPSATKNRTILQYITTDRTGILNITNGFNDLYGTGTLFTQELGIGTKIVSNGQIFTIQNIVSNTQATTVETANGTITNGTFKSYTNFAPIYYINELYPDRRSWLTGATIPNAKSIIDVYKLYTLSSYSVAGVTQSGSLPISYNNETDTSITAATNLVGISIFKRTSLQELSPFVLSGLTVPTTNFSLLLTKADPNSDLTLNGTITASFNSVGLTPPYTYVYSSNTVSYTSTTNSTTNTQTGLKSGLWKVYVTDSANNVSNVASITLNQKFHTFTNLNLIASGVTFFISGGVPTYNVYTVDQNDVADGFFSVTGLGDGTHNYTTPFVVGNTYRFNITDSVNAKVTGLIATISSTATLTMSLDSYINPACSTTNNGILNVSVLGSSGPFTYVYSKPGITITHTNILTNYDSINNASVGNWQIYASDGITTSNTVSITLTSSFFATTSSIPGVLTFNITGGTAPYRITSTNVNPILRYTANTSGSYSIIVPGGATYDFSIQDANNCITYVNQYVLIALTPTIVLTGFTNPSSNLLSNGFIGVSATGGISPYTYSINGGPYGSSGVFTGLTAGTYTVTVKDSQTPTPLTSSLLRTLVQTFNVSIYSGSNICLTASGGTAPYFVSINGGPNSAYTSPNYTCYSGVCGNNNVVVTDSVGNYYSANTYVVCPIEITYTANSITCIGRVDGELNIVATKGVPPYMYYLYYPSFISPINNSTGNFQNIGGGVSTIVVTDSDTPSNSASTTVNLSQTFNVLSTTVTGGTYLNISGGSSPYIVSYIKVPSQTTGTTTFTAVTAGQYFVPGLSSTLYVFSVRDSTNCTISNIRSTIPTVNSTLSIDIYNIVYPGCNTSPTGGQIFFSGSGGATPYVAYSASNGTTTYSYTTGGTFYNLSAGIWTLYLEDTLGTVEVDYVVLNNTEITPIVNIDYPNREVCITVPTNNLSPLTYDVIVGSSSYVISNENVTYCYPFTGCSTLYISVCPQSLSLSGCCYQNTFDISEGIDYTITTTFVNNQPNICLDINLNSSYSYPYLITFSGNSQYYDPASNNCFEVDACGGTYNITICNTPSNNIFYGFKTVFDFSSAPKQAVYPYGSLLEVSEGIFYGMTYDGGLSNLGTIFSADTNGNFDILVSFKGQSFNDGARPYGSLIKASDGKLYGMTFEGGQYNLGCIFVYTYGTSINIIHSFSYGIIASPDSKDGARPYGDLIQASNGNLYGITSEGGVNNDGIIFSCDTSGNYKKIYEFDTTTALGGFSPSFYSYNLIEPINGFLYGTTTVSNGGASAGSLFSYEINNNLPPIRRTTLTSHIVAPLCFGFNGYIYGLTIDGGALLYGEIIKVNTNGSGYQVVYEFSGQTYGDGATPYGGLKQTSNGLLYGLTTFGGINDKGIFYTLDIISEEYTNIASFDDKLTGYYPFYTSLIESLNGKFYGMSSDGGANLKGTIFEISLTGQTTGCCITESVIINSTTLPAPNIYGTIINGTSNVCVEIDTNNFYLPPYQVVVDGIYNSYNTLLSTNCYGIGSSCGPIQVQICTADFSDNNYFLLHKLDDSIVDQEGSAPYCKLLEYSAGIFYGLTSGGGQFGGGVIFSCNTSANYYPIYDFGDPITPNDGLSPFGSLIKSSFDNFMYGMTSEGGTKNVGIIFKIDNLGNYTKLFDFDNLFGEKPYGSLTEDPVNPNILYGLTSEGGLHGRGIIFSIDISVPISVTPLYDFDPAGIPFNGYTPLGSLIYLNSGPFPPTGILAGTTKEDSTTNLGGLFVFDLLLSSIVQSTYFNTNEGTYPLGDLLWDATSNKFYGLTNIGGQYNNGTLFSWDLSNIVPLFNFKDNYTGINPKGSLIFGSDNKLYGMTGTFPYDYGTIFSFDLNSNYFHKIYEFMGGTDGAYPGISLLEATDGKLYGVTAYGGKAYGTIFSLDKDSRPVCCYVETLGSTFIADIQTTWFTTTPGLCVTIDTNNFNNPTYAVQINTASGDTFNFIYDPNIGQNCYSLPISACGISTVTVSSGLPGYAYSFDELYRFSTINGTGTVPFGSLVQASNGILYGMTFFTTFPSGYGVIFSCDTSGNYGPIHTFGIGSDGRNPYGSLIQATNGDLYGTTYDGGIYQYGTIFKIGTNGSYSPGILRSFRLLATDGTSPYGSLFQASDGFLYGLTEYGPFPGLDSGTLFKCDLNGGSFSILHNFGSITNDGINPKGSVIEVSTGILYGMTSDGGTNLKGTIFSSNTSGSLYGIIHNFSGSTYLDGDAGNSTGSLLLGTNNIIYGLTPFGGQYNFGTIFSCNTLGSYGIIYNFTGNGKYPVGSLIEHNNGLLYGMTADGGSSNGNGIIFSFDKDTKDYEILYDFSDDPTINITPRSGLIEGLDGNLYGMGQSNNGSGIIFKLNVQASTGPICTYAESVDILCQSVPLTASVSTIASCTTGSTGELTVYYSGGSPNYIITVYIGSISNPTQSYKYTATTEGYHTFFGLSPRIWNVAIQDHSGIVPYYFSAFTANMSRIDVDTNIVNDQLCVSYSASSSFTGANSSVIFYIDDLATPITGSTLSSDTICFTATCGVNHTLRVSEGVDYLPGCDYYETFIIPCPPVGLTLLIGQPFCVTTAAAITAYASGGLPPYTYQIIDYTTNAIYSAQTSNDEFQFNIPPLTNHNYVAYLSDSLGNSATPIPFVITPSFYSDISFSNGNTILQFSGASAVRILVNNVVVTTGSGGYTSVPINQITTLQYPLSCGTTNTVTITGRVVDPDIPCCPFTYYYCSSSGSTFIPCDLVCDTYFVQPLCSGQSINDIQLLYTGGTPNYYLTLTNGFVLYSANTSATNFTFSPTNIGPPSNPTFNVTAGTWTLTVSDSLTDSCTQTINVTPTFDAIVNNITTTGFCLTISGGVGGYVVLLDGVGAISTSPTVTTSGNFGNSTYCFTGTCGNHTITVENNSIPCTITDNFSIPCNSLNCNYLFVNPSCDQISDGMITTNVVGGTPPYNFYLTNNNTQNTLSQLNHPTGSWSFINVSTGSWTISATSSDGLYCSSTLLLDGTFAVLSSASTNNEICLTISGGTPNYDIYVNNNIIISGVTSPGSYCVSANCNYNEWLVIDSVGCQVSGTTNVYCGLSIFLSATTNPGCDGAHNGQIVVYATGGTSPYSYSASNGTTIFTNNVGIFTNLNSDTWYLSVTDLSGSTANLTLPITLINSFYSNIVTYVNGFCVTITGGTQPYYVYLGNTSLAWDNNNVTNCYSADCTTISTITVRDSSI